MNCKLILTREQFLDGCPNCMGRDTSEKFKGVLMIADPSRSWLARWFQKKQDTKPGVYAMETDGEQAEFSEEDYELEDDEI